MIKIKKKKKTVIQRKEENDSKLNLHRIGKNKDRAER